MLPVFLETNIVLLVVGDLECSYTLCDNGFII